MSQRHIPNILTFLRIGLIPIFIYLLFAHVPHGKLLALAVFVIASITDAYDGRIARKYGFVTKLGIFLDPLADKFLVLSAFICFWFFGEVKLWMLLLIGFRDILVTGLRMIMQYKGLTMITSKVGKLKTILQISVIIVILLFFVMKSYNLTELIWLFQSYPIIYSLMVATTLVTAYTGFHYFYFNFKTLKMLFMSK